MYLVENINTGSASCLMVARSANGGQTWASVATVTTDGGNNNIHTASITTRRDPSGADDVLVTYARVVGNEEIEAALSLDGVVNFTVFNNVLNDAAPERTFMPWPAVDEFGNLHITWEVDTGADGSTPEGVLLHDVLDGTTLAGGADSIVSNLNLTDFDNANSKIPAQPNRGLFLGLVDRRRSKAAVPSTGACTSFTATAST